MGPNDYIIDASLSSISSNSSILQILLLLSPQYHCMQQAQLPLGWAQVPLAQEWGQGQSTLAQEAQEWAHPWVAAAAVVEWDLTLEWEPALVILE